MKLKNSIDLLGARAKMRYEIQTSQMQYDGADKETDQIDKY